MSNLTSAELDFLGNRFGAGWCKCLHHTVEKITPKVLADYCETRGFKPFPPAQESTDGNGLLYAYLLAEKGNAKVVASFGEYRHFPRAAAEGVLEGIRKIALVDRKDPSEIASEIIALVI